MIENLAKTNVEMSFKKQIHALTLRMYFKSYTVWREYQALFLVTFNIIISYIFPENFTEIHQVYQKIRIFASSILTIFVNFMDFFTQKS